MKSGSDLISDFWWLPKNVAIRDLLVVVGHHRPLTDEDDPRKIEWFHSLDKHGRISPEIKNCGLDFLSQWRTACKNSNVYRTLKVFDRNTEEATFLGPFLIDIDNSVWDNGYQENLNDAQTVTNQVVTYLVKQLKLSLNDLRIFFSGRKGFNVEICPEALGINGSVSDQIKLSSRKLDEIIAVLRKNNNVKDSYKEDRNIVSSQGTVIDRIYGDRFGYELKHPYIRLHHSINKWIRNDGSEIAQMKIELTIEQLWRISAAEISSKAEQLAQMPHHN